MTLRQPERFSLSESRYRPSSVDRVYASDYRSDWSIKGVQTFVAKENGEMARRLQNKDIALLIDVFRS